MNNNRFPRNSDYRSCRQTNNEPADKSNYCLCANQPISLAMAYVKLQPFEQTFSDENALIHGTVFPSLVLPYIAGGTCHA